jgi:UDP-2,3-diacylglucosamine pyrophosphatase LpxH
MHKLLLLPEEDNSGYKNRVAYLSGNHDEPLQKCDKISFGHVEIHREYIFHIEK